MSVLMAGTAAAARLPGLGPLRNGNYRGDPNLAPRCRARARTTGCPCRAPAMPNGRCRMHGGKCTGPKTAGGMARMIAANTTHGRYGAAGAAVRAERRHVRTVVGRSRVLLAAARLVKWLPADKSGQLRQFPPELSYLKHPTQVAFEAECAAKSCTVKAGAIGAGVAPRVREKERREAAAEASLRAPWIAAIAFARAAKRAARGSGRRGVRRVDIDAASRNALQLEIAFRAAGLRRRYVSGDERSDALRREAAGVVARARLSPAMELGLRTTTLGAPWMVGGLRRELDWRFGAARAAMPCAVRTGAVAL
jgi:hypothetical protein